MKIKKGNSFQEIDFNELPEHEKMKYEVAKELGLLDKVCQKGWKSLSAKETGRIGGIISRRKHCDDCKSQTEKNIDNNEMN